MGIDEERKEIACGLVDTIGESFSAHLIPVILLITSLICSLIGSYTFAKTLEYKAKQGLAGKDRQITVVPPREYKERFVGAMDGYFLACPGASDCSVFRTHPSDLIRWLSRQMV